MVDVLLVYPFFRPRFDRSPFRFPPLGIGYIASSLRQGGFTVKVLDCTFHDREGAIEEIKDSDPSIIGIYSMYSMEEESLQLAKNARSMTDLLVVGGPSPTVDPSSFLGAFDIAVIGEAENTMLEIASRALREGDPRTVTGIAFRDKEGLHYTEKREYLRDLDAVPFPARDLFEDAPYKEYYLRNFGYTMTSMISSRGCPFRCDFCSRPVFGDTFRSRSPKNIVDEMVAISNLGYDVVWFADDCFTISRERVMRICDEMIDRDLSVKWQCLSRVDTLDRETANKMREAGCRRIYFGIESGDEGTLQAMKKEINVRAAREAVCNANLADIETGAFFIIGYPGETDESILKTIDFGASLPLDYLSFTLPYPIPGTNLYEKTKDSLREPRKRRIRLIEHSLLFDSEFSEIKLKFGIVKGMVQFVIRRYLGAKGYRLLGKPFEKTTDRLFRILR